MDVRKMQFSELLKLRRDLGLKVAISSGKEYKESLALLFRVKDEIERRK